MALIVDLCQMLEIQMSIDLGRRDVRMAQQLLHRSQVATGLQHVAGERMPQHVRMQVLADSLHAMPTQAQLNGARSQRAAALTDEQRLCCLVAGWAHTKPVLQGAARHAADGQDAGLPPGQHPRG